MLRSLSAVLAMLLASCVAPSESTRDEARWVGGGIAGLVTAY